MVVLGKAIFAHILATGGLCLKSLLLRWWEWIRGVSAQFGGGYAFD
jgi:hypothetical protein